jgi:hypothetical protein
MPENIIRLIWLFPIAFILHDFEELILFEPWLKKNADAIKALIKDRAPHFVERQINVVLGKSSPQFALPICMIFLLTVLSTVLMAEFGISSLFLLASSLYFLHGFMHIGQAILMRRYIPALITSIFVVLPYGILLFWNLLDSHIVNTSELLVYFIISAILAIPFILIMHVVGEYLYKVLMKLVIN